MDQTAPSLHPVDPDEEVRQSAVARPVEEQLLILREALWEDAGRFVLNRMQRNQLLVQAAPRYSEGCYVIPYWPRFDRTYEHACERVLDMLARSQEHRLQSYYSEWLGPKYLREQARKRQVMEDIWREQRSDVLLVPAQLGNHHEAKAFAMRNAIWGQQNSDLASTRWA